MQPSPPAPPPFAGPGRTMFLTPEQEQQAAAAAAAAAAALGCSSMCSICGVTAALPNPANACSRCLPARVAIAETVPPLHHHDAAVARCPACSSYLSSNTTSTSPPRSSSWIRSAAAAAATPDDGLTQLLLRRVARRAARHGVAIAAAELVAAGPTTTGGSNRVALRVLLRLHEVEEAHVVEFAVHDQLCGACSRARARSSSAAGGSDEQWSAVVQVRQRASHRRTLLHLDQQIAAHGAADSAVRVDGSVARGNGIDFYFASRHHAARLVEFVSSVAPARVVVAAAAGNASAAFSVELCPICRDDLVFLPREASRALGGLGPLVLCVKVSKTVALLDASTMRVATMTMAEYDRHGGGSFIEPLLSSRRLVDYVVLDVETETVDRRHHGGSGTHHVPPPNHPVSWVQVARASDLGKNDVVFTVKTHIGWSLQPGDHALGYDLCSSVVDSCNNHDLERYWQQRRRNELPDVVLVKKKYERSASAVAGKKMMMQVEQDGGGGERRCAEVDELAMGIGCIELNPSDEKELDELLEDLSI